jgi:putative ATP-grasp target RiPP
MENPNPRDTPSAFADEPIASHSAQFGLARPHDAACGHHEPSADGLRPWNLRAATALTSSTAVQAGRLDGVRYDHTRQVAVIGDGTPLSEVIVDATADSVSNLDGDEGPSEDWKYDYIGDEPGSPA